MRDALLGLAVKDRDWVVVGATPEALIALGYLPVGRDFPVFLHPETRDEVALARTERKTAPGYHGFSVHADPGVTLDDDLARRDLTINAMAQDDAGQIIDPHGGRRDLAAKVLRHVSTAFAEDPVRILRLARFAARFADFTVAEETMALMRTMVDAGEVDALVSERVWQELSRGLMARRPSRMFEVLRACGALARLMPEVDRLWGVPQPPEHHPEVDTGVHLMLVLDMAAQLDAPLPVRYACLCHDLGKGTTPPDVLPRHLGHEQRSVALARAVGHRLRVPTDCRDLAEIVAREHGNIHRSAEFGAAALLRLLERCDALRRPARWDDVLLACECDARGRAGRAERPYPQRGRLLAAQRVALAVDTAAVAAAASARGLVGPAIGAAVQAARIEALAAFTVAAAQPDQLAHNAADHPIPPVRPVRRPAHPGAPMSDRIADHPVDPQFLQRWSPRAYTGEPIDEATLLGFLEAARWAPSSYNMQPWRFIYARAGTPAWAPLFGTLIEWNQSWAKDASALVLVMSALQGTPPGQKPQHNPSHAFDAGAGWAYLALQASLAGWAAHGMGGFDRDKAKAALGIPDEGYMLHEVVAIGRRADKSVLPEGLQPMEQPNGRLPLSALAAEGKFAF